jgi:predicted TIM-barrel fold metal-dependent hydrolase
MKIVDTHVHFGDWMFPIPRVGPEKLLSYMDLYQIEYSIVSSSRAILYDFVEGNRELLAIIMNYSRLWGYIVLNPHYPEESFREVEKYQNETKFVGFKFHPEQQAYRMNGKNAIKLLHHISNTRSELPVLIHTFGKESVENAGEAGALFPNLKIIMAHMGGETWQEGIDMAACCPNIYLDPCCSFSDADKIKTAVKTLGADRILFGSDATLLDPGFTIGMLRDAGITESQTEQIAYKNALKLFNLKIVESGSQGSGRDLLLREGDGIKGL